jgi:hypothetical protein
MWLLANSRSSPLFFDDAHLTPHPHVEEAFALLNDKGSGSKDWLFREGLQPEWELGSKSRVSNLGPNTDSEGGGGV